MEARRNNKSPSSYAIFKSIKNLKSCTQTIKACPLPKPKKCREIRNLEAELGVERYKNSFLTEEITQKKQEILRTNKYMNKLTVLQKDYDLLCYSVKRSEEIQEKQREEIENLKKKVKFLRNNNKMI